MLSFILCLLRRDFWLCFAWFWRDYKELTDFPQLLQTLFRVGFTLIGHDIPIPVLVEGCNRPILSHDTLYHMLASWNLYTSDMKASRRLILFRYWRWFLFFWYVQLAIIEVKCDLFVLSDTYLKIYFLVDLQRCVLLRSTFD